MPHDEAILGLAGYEIKEIRREGGSVIVSSRYTGHAPLNVVDPIGFPVNGGYTRKAVFRLKQAGCSFLEPVIKTWRKQIHRIFSRRMFTPALEARLHR